MEHSFRKLLQALSKKGGFEVLRMLKNSPRRWSWLEAQLKDKKSLSFRLKELIDLGLVQIVVQYDTPAGTKTYMLTPTGKRILELLEEIERVYKEGVKE